tara:strand:- start:4538 stop:5050 length:513 start_codon:yes stop_codon:yes gene_type:complete
MNETLSKAIKEKEKIINEMDTVILSTADSNGMPNASYAPTTTDKKGNFYIYISELSKHTQNLLNSNNASLMIIEDESKSNNLFARRRFTMNSKSKEIIRDSSEWNEKIELLENKFKEQIGFLKNMTDFHLFKLTPTDGLLVHGFGKAFRFVGQELNQINHLNDKGHTEKK